MNTVILSPIEHDMIEQHNTHLGLVFVWKKDGRETYRREIGLRDPDIGKLAWEGEKVCHGCFINYGVVMEMGNCNCSGRQLSKDGKWETFNYEHSHPVTDPA